jgi:hypothetical protein
MGLSVGTYRVRRSGGPAEVVQDAAAASIHQVGDPALEPAPARLPLETMRLRVASRRGARP